jgi:hypothetical protein
VEEPQILRLRPSGFAQDDTVVGIYRGVDSLELRLTLLREFPHLRIEIRGTRFGVTPSIWALPLVL